MKTVLLIDDDFAMIRILVEMVNKLGFNGICVERIDEIKTVLENQKVDGIISDLNLEGYKGLDITEVLKPLGIPFGVLSGWVEGNIGEKLETLGIPFMQKPVMMKDLKILCEVVVNG